MVGEDREPAPELHKRMADSEYRDESRPGKGAVTRPRRPARTVYRSDLVGRVRQASPPLVPRTEDERIRPPQCEG